MIRVAVLDDHPLVLAALDGLLEDAPDLLAVAAAAGAQALCRRLESAPADIVVLDYDLARGDGSSVYQRLKPCVRYLTVDQHGRVPDARYVYAAGEVTHDPTKQAGLAGQQAGAAADTIAAKAGIAIEPAPYTPVLEGVLLTECDATLMHRGPGRESDISSTVGRRGPLRPPPANAGQQLAAHLGDRRRDVAALAGEHADIALHAQIARVRA